MAPSKKQQKRRGSGGGVGVDFKKIKRKLGRKLPPPKNATNTEIKSKAIILPEQSLASDKSGLAVNKKGLTLKELLQQTSHHNAKVRRDALMGIRELLLKNPAELTSHKYTIIEKLRERVGDEDKVVRETLYKLFKSVIFPECKEENQAVFVPLLMAYMFNAMTNSAIEVRLMAFEFLDLVVEHYPSSFFLYAEKILQNYEDILLRNKLQEKGKLKIVFSGLLRCLSQLSCNSGEVDSVEKDAERRVLHAYDEPPEFDEEHSIIISKLKDLVPVLANCFKEFIPAGHDPYCDAQSFDCMLCLLQSINLSIRFFLNFTTEENMEQWPFDEEPAFDANVWAKTIFSVVFKMLIVMFPLTLQFSEKSEERYFSLNVKITEIFLHLSEWNFPSVDTLKKFLEFIESALLGKICSGSRSNKAIREKHLLPLLPFIPKLMSVVTSDWKSRVLEAFTKTFMDCNPVSPLKFACLSAIKEMLIPMDNREYRVPDILDYQISWIREFPKLLMLGDKDCCEVVLSLLRLGLVSPVDPFLIEEYDNLQHSLLEFFGNINYGPFVRLPVDCQNLSMACVYYFSHLDPDLLVSIGFCCICPDLNPLALIRILYDINGICEKGRLAIGDFISFGITLLLKFRVISENIFLENDAKFSNRKTFEEVTKIICKGISDQGDNSVLLRITENFTVEQLLTRPPLDNIRALLMLLVKLDSKPTKLRQQSITSLGDLLPGYLIDVACRIRIPLDENNKSVCSKTWKYYMMPCLSLFDNSPELLHLVLRAFGLLIKGSSSISLPFPHNQHATNHSDTINAIIAVLSVLSKDNKIQLIISSFKEDIDFILQAIVCLQSSDEISLTLEERHGVQSAADQLKVIISSLDKKKQRSILNKCKLPSSLHFS